jgi:hypothetical protein
MDSFTPIPNEWVDSLADGRLTMPMFTILCYLKRTCIWKTGVWRGTAERIQHGLNGEIKARQIQRYLKRVGVCGYISSAACGVPTKLTSITMSLTTTVRICC